MPLDESVIPHGYYCYTMESKDPMADLAKFGRIKTKVCPYWSRNPDKHLQESGHCKYLGCGDWEAKGPWLLWDQVKECGVNMPQDGEEL